MMIILNLHIVLLHHYMDGTSRFNVSISMLAEAYKFSGSNP